MSDLTRSPVRVFIALCFLLSLVLLTASAVGVDQFPSRSPLQLNTDLPDPVDADTATAYFPQVAVGGGYTTVFTLMNTGSAQLSARLTLTDSLGRAMDVPLSSASEYPASPEAGDRVSASFVDTFIPVGGTTFITAGPTDADRPVTGWAKVESTGGTLGGVATFRLTSAGKLQAVAGVLAANPIQVATIPVDNDDSLQRYTGYAVANPTGANVFIKIVVVDQNGSTVAFLNPSVLNALGPSRQVGRFLHQEGSQWLKFKGSMVLIGGPGQSFCVVALVQDQGQVTAIPVIPAKAPTIN